MLSSALSALMLYIHSWGPQLWQEERGGLDQTLS